MVVAASVVVVVSMSGRLDVVDSGSDAQAVNASVAARARTEMDRAITAA